MSHPTPAHLQKGQEVEDKALDFLQSKGLSLLERNFYCRGGELDLVMMDGQDLVFVEVRYRRNSSFGSAAESISIKKQQKLRIAAQTYLQRNPSLNFKGCRFDVLAIDGQNTGQKIDWISDAF